MSNQNIPFVEIENYIRNLIFKNCGVFDRNSIMMQSHEWMQKFPVEFNGILNFIENKERNDDMMDDSTPSVAIGDRFADDSTPSVAFGSRFADDSTPSVAYGGYADDSTMSVAFGSRFADDSTPSVAHYEEYSGNIMPDPMSSISDSPMGSDHIDSSPGGYPDEFESDMPLQRTMSHGPPRN
jgi:hypothetical protein